MIADFRVSFLSFTLLVFTLGLVFGPVDAGPLHDAVRSGDAERVRTLMTPGLDIDARDNYGVAAIHMAILQGNLELVKILISNGADVNIAVNSSRSEGRFYVHLHEYTPLHIAAHIHPMATDLYPTDIASLLIVHGADVNRTTDAGESAMHLAVRRGNDRLVELLIANGADVNARDFEDYTPLHNAAWNGHLSLVELLVNSGANVHAIAYDGRTPYYCAARKNHQHVTAFLEKLGVVE